MYLLTYLQLCIGCFALGLPHQLFCECEIHDNVFIQLSCPVVGSYRPTIDGCAENEGPENGGPENGGPKLG